MRAAPASWLILADDLTGACDCAVSFAAHGQPASVIWGESPAEAPVLAVDMDSRRLSAPEARAALHARFSKGTAGRQVYKKVDSTWRGQPAAEIAAALRALQAHRPETLAILAPAFPATGRTQRGGRLFLGGAPLEESALWQQDHSYADADLIRILAEEGLRLRLVTESGALQEEAGSGAELLLCDAETPDDLDRIAAAGLALGRPVLWAGSAGLAQSLARLTATRRAAPRPWPRPGLGGFLFVIGSIAGPSRAAAEVLAADPGLLPMAIARALLRGEAAGAHGQEIAAALARGQDVLVTIAEETAPDLAEGAALAASLARSLAPAASALGALFVTGGETARALLSAFGVTSIRLQGEIEAGVPWGQTEGAIQRPVITKAGGFGTAETLRRCLDHLRALRAQETET